MEQLNIEGYNVRVDVQRTKELYEPLPLVSEEAHCGCMDCCYYVEAVTRTSSAILEFFQQFGVDPRKEASVWKAAEFDDGAYLYIVDYRFVGKIEDAEQLGWIEIDNAKFSLTNYPILPAPNILKSVIPPIIELQVEIMFSHKIKVTDDQ